MTMLIASMSIFEVQSKENIENQPKPTNIAGESYQIRGGRKDRLFLPERHESDDAGKRGFESI